MTFKEGASGAYQNTDYQIDFGNSYEGDTVKNNIVPPKVVKQVSVDGGKTWHDSKDLPDTDSNYDYKLIFYYSDYLVACLRVIVTLYAYSLVPQS